MHTILSNPLWIDTHAHLDAKELSDEVGGVPAVCLSARQAGVRLVVIPAVDAHNWGAVRALAHANEDAYALGIHPLYIPHAAEGDLAALEQQLASQCEDPRLVAVGEIGLDFFTPEQCTAEARALQEHLYREQLKLARKYKLPVLLHVRKSADRLLKHLRDLAQNGHTWSGIAHAFNGSVVQAQEFIRLGFKLGFGGAVTFERALQLRQLVRTLPLDALVMETDAPDIPPHWLYTTAQNRTQGVPQRRNTPAELPRIGEVVASLRGMSVQALADATSQNACVALPRLAALLV
jgi:TatD DNase family protein